MVTNLDGLLADDRLARLFSIEGRHCALQLWILQIKCDQLKENRVVYGRLLPYSHSSNSWTFSDNDDFLTIGQVKAKVTRLNLYIKSDLCAELLRLLSAGRSISAVSEELKLVIQKRLKAQFGEASLREGNQTYRPVAYLLNRDAYDRRSICSPHGSAGAFSASIIQSNKKELFRLSEDYETGLAELVTQHLNADTGLDFGGADIKRLGDLELLVFPTLDDREQNLLNVSWEDSPRTLVARFNPVQLPHFTGFQFRLSIVNDGEIIYSGLATAVCDGAGEFVCKFELSDQLREWTDSTELEIFGFHGDSSNASMLCCRWQIGYVREINLQGHLVNNRGGQVKFDWLQKTVRPSASARTKAALTINRGELGFSNSISGRKVDPWVPINRDFISLFERLHPPKSEGLFLLRWGKEDPESRLQFTEWFKGLLAKHQKHQIVIFDPYFEDAGLGLLLLCAAQNADYIVFRSLPKRQVKEKAAAPNEFEEDTSSRIENLLKNCEHNRHLLRRLKLRIYGLKEGRLHDRYILIVGADGLPVSGFNLSNSFQKAAENYPLLITPIPADILLKIDKYKSGLVQEANALQSKYEAENPTIRILFDSRESSSTVGQIYESLRFLENQHAGDVLSILTGQPSLQGLSGDSLKECLRVMDLLSGGGLALSDAIGLQNCLSQRDIDFPGFTATWEVIGNVLAHSHIEDYRLRELNPEHGFLEFLGRFLESAFSRVPDEVGKEVTVIDAQFFQMPIETLLGSAYRLQHLFHATKYTVLTWTEYYTIKFLWWFAPDTLLSIAEAQMASVPMEPQGLDTLRLSLLSQIVSEISLAVQFSASTVQRDRLIQSSNGLLQWMGLNAIEALLEEQGGLDGVLELVADFSYPERVRALGWMLHHASSNPHKGDIYKGLVAALHDTLPWNIPAEELVRLVNSLRGHMKQLAWSEPWLFQDVVFPLLEKTRANYDDACVIWVQELTTMLEPAQTNHSLLFERAREGQTTNIAAFLFANSSPTRQQACLESMQNVLKRQQRVVLQPLASTSNWTRWDRALKVSLWLLAFFRWSEFYLRQRDITDHELERLSLTARGLVMHRPMSEWQSDLAGKRDELAAFLEQVDELLEKCDGESNPQNQLNK